MNNPQRMIFNRKLPSNLMPGAEPIYKNAGDTGILFLHGLTGSSYEGKYLAEYFYSRGFTVWVPLLRGHGTRPRDLQRVRWQEWYEDARQAFYEMRQMCSRVIVCGQSMGGSLGLHLASHYKVDGLICLAGAVFLTDWRLRFLPFARHFIPYQYKSKGPDIFSKPAKRKSAAYHRYPIRSIVELLKLLEHVKEDLVDIQTPLFLIHSRKDHVISYDNMDYIYRHVASRHKQILTLENSYHIISVDIEKNKVFTEIENFISEVLKIESVKTGENGSGLAVK